MQGAFVATLAGVRQGREKRALEVAAEVNEWWGRRAAEGKCTPPEMFFSPVKGTAMWIVKGDLDVLHELERKAEAQHLLMKSALVFSDFAYDIEFTADAADEYIGRFATTAGELGLM